MDPHYSRALDEIYRLRIALANEANHVENMATLVTFPRGQRVIALAMVERMRLAARGETQRAYGLLDSAFHKVLLRSAGAPETLTRWQWEHQDDTAQGRAAHSG